jgi:hypothetical protein
VLTYLLAAFPVLGGDPGKSATDDHDTLSTHVSCSLLSQIFRKIRHQS